MFVHQLLARCRRECGCSSRWPISVLLVGVVGLAALVAALARVRCRPTAAGSCPGSPSRSALALVGGLFVDLVVPVPRFDPTVDRGLLGVLAGTVARRAGGHARCCTPTTQYTGGRGAVRRRRARRPGHRCSGSPPRSSSAPRRRSKRSAASADARAVAGRGADRADRAGGLPHRPRHPRLSVRAVLAVVAARRRRARWPSGSGARAIGCTRWPRARGRGLPRRPVRPPAGGPRARRPLPGPGRCAGATGTSRWPASGCTSASSSRHDLRRDAHRRGAPVARLLARRVRPRCRATASTGTLVLPYPALARMSRVPGLTLDLSRGGRLRADGVAAGGRA